MRKKIKTKKSYLNIAFKNDFVNAIFLFIFFAFVFAFLFSANRKVSSQRKALESELVAIQERIAKIHREKEILQEKISQSESDAYLEKVAREQLNFQKEGEVVVAFPFIGEESGLKESTNSQTDEEKKELGFWDKIWLKIRD